jgi:glutathione peroxidase-family protein
MSSLQHLVMDSIDGKPVAFEQYKGHVSLVVNVASR